MLKTMLIIIKDEQMRDASEHSENDQDEDDEVQDAIQPDDEDEDVDPNTPSIKIEPPSATLANFKPETTKRGSKAAMSKLTKDSGSKEASRQARDVLSKPIRESFGKLGKVSKNAPPSNGDADDDVEGMEEAEGDVDPEGEGDVDLDVEPDEDLDPEANEDADADVNEEANEDGEGDVELQPADRQEALDALAKLELKFALIRQRIYVDKMEELAKEEGWVRQGKLLFLFLFAKRLIRE
jgi:hypothetical protein